MDNSKISDSHWEWDCVPAGRDWIPPGWGPVEASKVRDITAEEAERKYGKPMCGLGPVPAISIGRSHAKKYSDGAIVPVLKWVEGFVKNPRFVQYAEVTKKLGKLSPKYCSELTLCTKALFSELERSGKLSQVPESLIIVLNTLHLMHPGGTWLTSVEKEGQDLVFVAEFKDYEGDPFAHKYRLRNYLSAEDVELESICDAPAVYYEKSHGPDGDCCDVV
ncbi:MAG: hypothetical protein LBF42_01265 [Puniceicoccales bacterium]|jgi:hypothetical protein|nr:hypothetical protein [Puniceicoccales bacterium]